MSGDAEIGRCLCLSVDVQGYGTRDDATQGEIQQVLLRMLDTAGARAGVDRGRWRRQPKGDEELALIPAGAAAQRVVGEFCLELAAVLHRYNLQASRVGRLRLRMALDEGPVQEAANGFVGRAVVGASRMASSQVARQALADEPDADLVLVLSQGVYRDWVATGRGAFKPDQFRRVRVREKEVREDAWLWVPGARPDRDLRVSDAVSAGTTGPGADGGPTRQEQEPGAWPSRDVDVARLIRDYLAGRVQMQVIVVITGDADSPASVALSSGCPPRSGLVDAKPEGAGTQMRIDASGKTAEEVAAQVADALGAEAQGGRGLSDYQGSMSGTGVILEDIDEASDPDAVVSQVITPLVRRDARVIAGFRREAPPSAVALGIDALASFVDKVGEAERAARESHRQVAARVAGVPQVPGYAAKLRTRLVEIRAAAAGGQQVVTELTEAVSDAARAHHAVEDLRVRLDEALAHRNALRGQLESYQAMAANGGLAEDIDLGELYGAAQELLWRGRCDLAVAEEAVARYARAIHEKLDRGGAA